MKNLDLTKYKQKMSCSLKKTQKKNISPFKPVKKGMKKLHLTKYKPKMSCWLKTQNKLYFSV